MTHNWWLAVFAAITALNIGISMVVDRRRNAMARELATQAEIVKDLERSVLHMDAIVAAWMRRQ